MFGLPLQQPVIKLALARLDRADVATGQKQFNRKGDHRRFRRQTKPADGIFHNTDKIGTRQRNRRDTQYFKLCGCTAARCGAGPSGRVADDDGVNACGLHLARGIFLANQTIALREGVDRQHFDAGKIRLE